jgi:phage terminase large subunit GpA-like protein
VSELLGRTWEHATGARLSLQHLAIDTGYATQSVYQWARSQDRHTVLPVRGVGTYDRIVPVAGPTKVEVKQDGQRLKRGLGLWTVSVSFFKKELYKQLGYEKPTGEQLLEGFTYPAGFVHLPDTTSDEWVKQLVAEQQVIIRSKKGFNARTEWRQLRPRNEALDARVYARAAVWLAGADRWGDSRWRALEAQLGIAEPPPRKPPPQPLNNGPGGPVTAERAAPVPEGAGSPPTPTAGKIRGGIRTMSGPRRRRVAYWQG